MSVGRRAYHPSYGLVDELLARLNGWGYMHKVMRMTCLLAVGKFPNAVSGLIQWALSTVEAWCGEHGVNPDKTELVFTRKRKLSGFLQPRLFGKVLQRSVG